MRTNAILAGAALLALFAASHASIGQGGSGGGGATAWGAITGTLNDQADLKSALDAKVASVNGKTGTVVLTAADIGCDPTLTTCSYTVTLTTAQVVALVSTPITVTGLTAPGASQYWRVHDMVFDWKPGADAFTWYGTIFVGLEQGNENYFPLMADAFSTSGEDAESAQTRAATAAITYSGDPSTFVNQAVQVASLGVGYGPSTGRVSNAQSSINSGGSGWMAGDTFELTCPDATNAVGEVDTVTGDAIATFHWTNRGVGCLAQLNQDLTATGLSIGMGATVDIAAVETLACAMGDVCATLKVTISASKYTLQ